MQALRPADPGGAIQQRLREDFGRVVRGEAGAGPASWFLGWLGFGARPRGLTERFASAAVVLAVLGGGGGAAAGASPAEAVSAVTQFARSVAANIGPRDESPPGPGTPSPTAAATETPSPTPVATSTPPGPTPNQAASAPAQPTPTPSASAEADDDDEDDDSPNSGPGSSSSGSGRSGGSDDPPGSEED